MKVKYNNKSLKFNGVIDGVFISTNENDIKRNWNAIGADIQEFNKLIPYKQYVSFIEGDLFVTLCLYIDDNPLNDIIYIMHWFPKGILLEDIDNPILKKMFSDFYIEDGITVDEFLSKYK
jgi:hypothetical protein